MTERNAEGKTPVPTGWEHFGLGVLARGYGFDQPAKNGANGLAHVRPDEPRIRLPVPNVFPSFAEDQWSRIVRRLTLWCRRKERVAGGVLSQQHVLSVQTDPADPETLYKLFKIGNGRTELGYQIQWQERLLEHVGPETVHYRVSDGVVSRLDPVSHRGTLPSTGEHLVACIPSLRMAVEVGVFHSTKGLERLWLRFQTYEATMKRLDDRVPPPDRE